MKSGWMKCSSSAIFLIICQSSEFEDFLFRRVQAGARAIRLDKIIVANDRKDRVILEARMHREIHVLGDGHVFVVTDQRTLDHVVALSVRIEPDLGGETMRDHVGVMRGG